MTYYDNLNEFFKKNEENPLPPAAQLLMLHLLHENNRHQNAGVLTVTDARLQQVTNLSKNSITTAKRTLKNEGYIDYRTDAENPRAGTKYAISGGVEKPEPYKVMEDRWKGAMRYGRNNTANSKVIKPWE